jgi:hypothetical protein
VIFDAGTQPGPVRDFSHALVRELAALDIKVNIRTAPNEVVEGIPFDQDD